MKNIFFFEKRYIFFGIFCAGLLGSFLFFFYQKPQDVEIPVENLLGEEGENESIEGKVKEEITSEENQGVEFFSPLDSPKERISKKPFGIWIHPQNSPVFPERFSGYHTGIDLEIFPGEEDDDVEVKALCSGEIFDLKTVSGYGGVVLQSCLYEEQPITVLYGHIDGKRTRFSVGDQMKAGAVLGFLGKGYSEETDGERKHLHLGIIKGNKENFLGYVVSKDLLDQWIDPCKLICSL